MRIPDALARLRASIPQLVWAVDGSTIQGRGDDDARVDITLNESAGVLQLATPFRDFDYMVRGLALGAAAARGEDAVVDARSTLDNLSALSPERAVEWLEAVLGDTAHLGAGHRRDESPSLAILRRLPRARHSYGNLAHAVRTLVRRALSDPDAVSDDMLSELRELVLRLDLHSLVADLWTAAQNVEVFDALPLRRRVDCLKMLGSMSVAVPSHFWTAIAARDPDHYAILAISALLGSRPQHTTSAIELLPLLPDLAMVGHALQVIWAANPDVDVAHRDALQVVAPACKPVIRKVVNEWIGRLGGGV